MMMMLMAVMTMVMAVIMMKMISGGVHGEMEEMIESYVEISVVSRFPLSCSSLSYWYVGTHGPLLVHIEACLGWGGCGIYGYIHNRCIACLTSINIVYIPFYFWGQQHRQTVEIANIVSLLSSPITGHHQHSCAR